MSLDKPLLILIIEFLALRVSVVMTIASNSLIDQMLFIKVRWIPGKKQAGVLAICRFPI